MNIWQRTRSELSRRRFRLGLNLRRYRRALAYARGTLTADQAQDITLDLEMTAGWFHLHTLDADFVLEEALEQYEDHPDLARLVLSGCSYVCNKWENFGDANLEARSWAIRMAAEFAEAEGIVLQPTAEAIAEAADLEAAFSGRDAA